MIVDRSRGGPPLLLATHSLTERAEPEIDTVGLLFLIFAVAITAAAAMVAYKANTANALVAASS
jgi:hypothetical protein